MRNFGNKLGLAVFCCALCLCTQAMAQAPGLLAQVDEPEEQNFLVWLLHCLGLFGLLSVLAGIAIFIGSWVVVFAARRPAVIASYFVFLLFPLLLAAVTALKGAVGAFSAVAMAGVEMKQWQIAGNISEILVPLLSAILLTIPSYVVVSIGLFVRTLFAGGDAPTRGGGPKSAA